MRNRLLVVLSFLLILVSCKKDEHRIYYESGTAPVLITSTTATTMVLNQADSTKTALKLSWTNPNYRFTTGLSSQDVTYVIQVDTAGKNFTSQKLQEVSISKNLDITYSVREFNGIFTKMELLENKAHDVEMRIKSTLGGGSVPLFSNVIKMRVTPYLDVAVPIPPTGELYMTGSAVASDWTNNPPASQKFTKLSNTEYTITVPLVSGKHYKFLSTPGQWQPQYGGKEAAGGDLGFNMGGGSDPDAVPTPSEAGNYKITINFKTGKYTVVKQ